MRAADALKNTDATHEIAQRYADAAVCYKKVWPEGAIDCMEKGCEIYVDMGRFATAAKLKAGPPRAEPRAPRVARGRGRRRARARACR
jgi:hypothetical protein